jgi:hypothetical protein
MKQVLVKLLVPQLHSKFSALYTARRLIAILTKPASYLTFCNMLILLWLRAVSPTPNLEDHPIKAVCRCLFNIFTAMPHIWRPCWEKLIAINKPDNQNVHILLLDSGVIIFTVYVPKLPQTICCLLNVLP